MTAAADSSVERVRENAQAPRWRWRLAGLVAGLAGLAASYAVSLMLTVRQSPVVAVDELLIAITPGVVVRWALDTVGPADKPLLVGATIAILVVVFCLLGDQARDGLWRADTGYLILAAIGLIAVLTRPGASRWDLVPLAVGLLGWVVGLRWVTSPLQAASAPATPGPSRRTLLLAVGAAVVAAGGRWAGRGRRRVEKVRRLVHLGGVTSPEVDAAYVTAAEGLAPWQTPVRDFYVIHTAIAVPTIDPFEWRLRIHGMVERELTLTYDDLARRELTEQWMTLNCVSNQVGGGLIGNAWWSGVRLTGLLAEAGAHTDADAVLQTSQDGWTCGTPLAALQDQRGAMLAMAMNGEALTLEHGFPVRTIVPGLFGYVSACKWVVDLEVTRFEDFTAFWTANGWSERGPVKLASRIDVPRSGDSVSAGAVTFAGVAWNQGVGVSGVQIAVDGGAWQDARLAEVPSVNTWVQWLAVTQVAPGDHVVKVSARGADGQWQTSVRRDVLPDGATGWHQVEFSAE